jgi:hypothetical protein
LPCLLAQAGDVLAKDDVEIALGGGHALEFDEGNT